MTRGSRRLLACLAAVASAAACGERPEPEPARRIVSVTVASPSLANMVGAPAERTALVYLPPGYHDRPSRRYPVVYLLHAFGATPEDWMGGERGYEGLDVAATLDSLIASGAASKMIVVMPDASTPLGGSWYASSPVSGRWEEFLAEELVDHVDGAFRTRAERTQRGIAGQSMGAYGAMRIALLRPDRFGAVLAMGPVLVEDANPLGEPGMMAALEADPGDPETAPVPARVLWSRARAFSPDPVAPPLLGQLPYALVRGDPVRRDDVWELWVDATLRRLVDLHAGALRDLTIRIEVGTDDALLDEVRHLSGRLRETGVDHELAVFRGGHVAGVRERFESSVFQYFSSVFGGR